MLVLCGILSLINGDVSQLAKMEHIIKKCRYSECGKEFSVRPSLQRVNFCSTLCYHSSMKGVATWNKGKKGVQAGYWAGKKRPELSGPNGYQWKEDRTTLVKSEKKHLDGLYRGWMKSVKNRDGWVCKISNGDCFGRLEAHHILRWKDYPELRYEVNNGITLCHFHHPRKINDEMKLSPYFQELVNNS